MTDWRTLCEELLDELLARPLIPDRALIDRARATLAQPEPEVVGPTDEDLLATLDKATADFPPRHPEAEALNAVEYHLALELRKARAAIAADRARYGHQTAPAPAGEVAKLAADIRHFLSGYRQMRGLDPEHIYSIHRGDAMEAHITVSGLTRAADLLEQRQAAPVPVAVSERPWERDGWCHPQERWAWFYNRRIGWRDAIPPESLKPPTLFPYTHSLPFDALPQPSGEVEK